MRTIKISLTIIMAFAIWRIVTLAIFLIVGQAVKPNANKPDVIVQLNLENSLAQLKSNLSTGDSGWYFGIVRDGYTREQFNLSSQKNWAFFPVLPILMKACSFLTNQKLVLAGVIVANLLFLGSLFLLFYFIRLLEYPEEDAFRAVWLLLAFPLSYLFGNPMTEPVLLFISLLAFTLAKKNYWILAGVAMAIATATRPTGVLILPAFYWMIIQSGRYKSPQVILAAIIAPLGILLFAYYLHHLTGNALAFYDIQVKWRPLGSLMTLGKELIDNPFLVAKGWNFIWLNLIFGLIGISLAAFFVRKREFTWAIFLIVPILMALSSGSLLALTRIVGGLFPLYLGLSIITKNNNYFYPILFLFSGMMFVLCVLAGLGVPFALT